MRRANAIQIAVMAFLGTPALTTSHSFAQEAPDLRGTWKANAEMVRQSMSAATTDAPVIENVEYVIVINLQKGRNFSGSRIVNGQTSPVVGALAIGENGIAASGVEGTYAGRLITPTSMNLCHTGVAGTSLVAGCAIFRRSP